MSVLELKGDILNLVSQLEDEQLLLLVRELLLEVNNPDTSAESSDWWDELPAYQQEHLSRLLDKIRNGTAVLIPHEEAMKQLKMGRYASRMVAGVA